MKQLGGVLETTKVKLDACQSAARKAAAPIICSGLSPIKISRRRLQTAIAILCNTPTVSFSVLISSRQSPTTSGKRNFCHYRSHGHFMGNVIIPLCYSNFYTDPA